ncbi:MAG: TetR/AcrR family transcriptional regulator [Pseudomonadota bacterium]
MKKTADAEVVDGRRLRSERSKQAILKACEVLLREGQLVPTAQMISDKAGVPIRSFFRHFPDMETLFRTVDATLQTEFDRIFAERPPAGSLRERIASAINLRADTYDTWNPVFRSTKAQLWRYTILQENYARGQKRFRKEFEKRVPELKGLDTDARELIDGLASFEMWTRLRDHQKLSKSRCVDMLQNMIESIIRDQGHAS